MRLAVITVAGLSARFNHNFSIPVLKSIYHEGDPHRTLLMRQCVQCQDLDGMIVVGGYQYESLSCYIGKFMPENIRKKISLIYNEYYDKYASGYSLYLGLLKAISLGNGQLDEVIFMEGDLILDHESLKKVLASGKDVLTYTTETIDSRKAVVVYENADGKYRYAFNDKHGLLYIGEPFMHIWNSAQVWKFKNMKKLEIACEQFFNEAIEGTSLEIVQRYFAQVEKRDVSVMPFKLWMNCNKREDWYCFRRWENEAYYF